MEATLRVGLPGWLVLGRQPTWQTALDVAPLVEEWALAFLDPVDALRRSAPAALKQPGWELAGRATVTPALMRLVRDAAADADIRALVERALSGGAVSVHGTCLIVALAAVAALDANVGKASSFVLAETRKRKVAREAAAAQRERQRSAPADAADTPEAVPTQGAKGDAEATGGVRPNLSAIATDAWGEAAR